MKKNPTKLNWEITTEFLFIDREKEVDCILCPLFYGLPIWAWGPQKSCDFIFLLQAKFNFFWSTEWR